MSTVPVANPATKLLAEAPLSLCLAFIPPTLAGQVRRVSGLLGSPRGEPRVVRYAASRFYNPREEKFLFSWHEPALPRPMGLRPTRAASFTARTNSPLLQPPWLRQLGWTWAAGVCDFGDSYTSLIIRSNRGMARDEPNLHERELSPDLMLNFPDEYVPSSE